MTDRRLRHRSIRTAEVQAPTPVMLTSGTDATDRIQPGNKYSTASVALTGGYTYYLAFVTQRNAGGFGNPTCTQTGATWSKQGEGVFNSSGRGMSVWRATPGSNVAAAAIQLGSSSGITLVHGLWLVVEIPATQASNEYVDTADNSSGSSGSAAVTAAVAKGDVLLGFAAVGGGVSAINTTDGAAELDDITIDNVALEVAWNPGDGAITTVSKSWSPGSNYNIGALAVRF